MKATIKKIYKKTVKTPNTTFDKICIDCDVVINEKNEVKTYKSEMSPEYAKKYFNFCKLSSVDAIGHPCEVTLRKRQYTNAAGEERTYTEIKYLNILGEDGKPIIMRKEAVSPVEDVGF